MEHIKSHTIDVNASLNPSFVSTVEIVEDLGNLKTLEFQENQEIERSHSDCCQDSVAAVDCSGEEKNSATLQLSGSLEQGQDSSMHHLKYKGVNSDILSPLSPHRMASSPDPGTVSKMGAQLLDSDSQNMKIDLSELNATKIWGPKLWRIFFYISLWYLFSMCLSLYNKFVLGNKHGHFPAPLLMTTIHFIMQFLIAIIVSRFSCISTVAPRSMSWNDYILRVVPTGIITAADIGLSNLSLTVITLTFYTMCKASAPVFLLLFAFAFSLESPSFKLFGVIIIISIGVLLTVAGETEFDMVGFVLVMSASVSSGLRWVLLQVLLQKEKFGMTNPLVTLMYLTPVMASVCGTLSFFIEPWHLLMGTNYFDSWQDSMMSLAIMTIGGLLAFFMIITEFLLISETSAVSFSVAGTVKEGATIIVSHFVFKDQFTKWNSLGLFIMIFGVSLFNIYKIKRLRDAKTSEVNMKAMTHSDAERQNLLSKCEPSAAINGSYLEASLSSHKGHFLSGSPREGLSPRLTQSPRFAPSFHSPRFASSLRSEGLQDDSEKSISS